MLPDRVRNQAAALRHSESRGHCERLAAPAGGRATDHLPLEPDPAANARVWLSRGSLKRPADRLLPDEREK